MDAADSRSGGGLLEACFGFLALTIAIGIGRFSFTPIVALMKHRMVLSDAVLGTVASAHHLGYLAGVVIAFKVALDYRRSAQLIILLCAVNAGTFLLFPSLSDSVPVWLALRVISGAASGVSFMLAVNAVAGALAAHQRTWLPFFSFSGVGVGIVIGALGCLAAGDDWRDAWRICGGIAGFGCVLLMGLFYGADWQRPLPVKVPSRHGANRQRYPFFLLFTYTVEGGAYIVTATFLVLGITESGIVQAEYAGWYWVGFGLVTAPSTLLWAKVVSRFGYGYSLAAAYWLQMAGALLATSEQIYALMVATLLLGITFMGITSIAILWARTLNPRVETLAMQLTLVYSIAQFATPVLAGISLQSTGSVNQAYLASAVALWLAGALIWRAASGTKDQPNVVRNRGV